MIVNIKNNTKESLFINMKNDILVLGGGVDTSFIIKKTFKNKARIILIDKDQNCPSIKYADSFFKYNLKNKKKIFQVFKILKSKNKNTFIFSYNSFPETLRTLNYIRKEKFKIDLFMNKKRTYLVLKKNKLNVPRVINKIKKGIFYIQKPFFESYNSKGVKLIKNPKKNKTTIIQEYINGTEYNASIIVKNQEIYVYKILKKINEQNSNNVIQKGYESVLTKNIHITLEAKKIKKIFMFNNCFFNFDFVINNNKKFIIDIGYGLDKNLIYFFEKNNQKFINLFYNLTLNRNFKFHTNNFKYRIMIFKKNNRFLIK